MDSNGWRRTASGRQRSLMLRALRIPIGWSELIKRTFRKVVSDNCLGLSAQLAYYFFLALFPALLFMVALIGFLPVGDVMNTILSMLGRVAPHDVLTIIEDQVTKITAAKSGGLLTIGALGALWSMSTGVTAIVDTLNQTYSIQESRPWWKVRLIAIALTVALALFVIVAFTLLLGGPALGERVADAFRLGAAFRWTWLIAQWPVVFALIGLAIAFVYYYAPDAEQEWVWITPGSLVATILWLAISLVFRIYVTNFANYNATYGAIGGVIVLMLWFYCSGLAILIGAEVNAEAEKASIYGKNPGEKRASTPTPMAAVLGQERDPPPLPPRPATAANCAVDDELLQASRAPRPARASDWILSGVVLAEAALVTYVKLRSRLRKVTDR
jgi:membrane protein